jgi:hypothetical protein
MPKADFSDWQFGHLSDQIENLIRASMTEGFDLSEEEQGYITLEPNEKGDATFYAEWFLLGGKAAFRWTIAEIIEPIVNDRLDPKSMEESEIAAYLTVADQLEESARKIRDAYYAHRPHIKRP